MIRVWTAALLLVSGVVYNPSIVQAQVGNCPSARPSADELNRIRNAGRWLALYEIVCNRADEALKTQGYSVDESPCLAHRGEEGWSVVYGDWNDGALEQRVIVRLNSAREVTAVEANQSVVRAGWAHEFSRAASVGRGRAEEELGGLMEEHKYGIIVAKYPWDDSTLTTYVFPDPEDDIVLGGDLRVEINANTGVVLESKRLHNEVISMGKPSNNAEASVSTAVRTCLPTETDVFMVLRRNSSLPHIVVAEEWIYGIEPNGEVKALRRREN